MSAHQASIIAPIALFFTIFAVMYINILIAKKKIREWRRYSGWYFVHSVVGVLIKERATNWVDRFGYSEAQALILSKQQFATMVELFAAVLSVMVVLSTLQTR